MSFNQTKPIIYQITDGTLTDESVSTHGFDSILELIRIAVSEKISMIQLREKNLSARVLFELTKQAAQITKGTESRLLVNDRADIALAAEADGVQLTSVSLPTAIIRKTFPCDFLIGVSTHSLIEAQTAFDEGADFAVFGPVFDTPSKRIYGKPVGLEKLKDVSDALKPFPVIAIGGIDLTNAKATLQNDASGIAAIRLLHDATNLHDVIQSIKSFEL
jgi:thiamine-phosphate pyrophosphorylase